MVLKPGNYLIVTNLATRSTGYTFQQFENKRFEVIMNKENNIAESSCSAEGIKNTTLL